MANFYASYPPSGAGTSGTVTSINASGGTTGFSFTGGPITTSGTLTLTGTLGAANGGTNLTSYTAGDLLYATGATTLAKLAIGTAGQVLKVSGGLPSWGTDLNAVTSVSNSDSSLTISPTTGAVVASLNLAHTNAFTIIQKVDLNTVAGPAADTGVGFHVIGADGSVTGFEADSFGTVARYTLRRANGTAATPTAILSGDQIGSFNARGYYVTGGPAYSGIQASLAPTATQNWTSTTLGTKWIVNVTPNNSATLTVAATFDQDLSLTVVGNISGANLSGTNTGDQTITLTGDITGSGTGSFATTYNGTVPIAKGGTNSTATLNNNRFMVSSGGAIVEAGAVTASRALASDANGLPVASVTTAAELAFVNGVTSAIQTQLNGKEPSITTLSIAKGGTNSGTALNNNRFIVSSGSALVENAAVTASRALASDTNGLPVAATTTTTELNFVSGVTSAIQTQINAKLTASAGQIPGTTTNDSANSGNIGQIIEATIAQGSATSLTNGAFKTVTSIPITQGQWQIESVIGYTGTATAVTYIGIYVSTTTNSDSGSTPGDSSYLMSAPSNLVMNDSGVNLGGISVKVPNSTTTTYYLVALAGFAAGTCNAYGRIRATRVR